MDIDKPLDDLIPKRKQRTSTGGADRKPRQSRERRDPAPYARPPPRSTDEAWVHDAYTGPDTRRGGRARGGDGAGAAAPAFVTASPRIEVSGIHYEVTADELKSIFSQAGTIVQGPTIRYDRSGRSTGVALIEYASAQQAKVALNQYDGAMTKGQTISIKLIAPARPPAAKKTESAGGAGKSLMQRLGATERDLGSRLGNAREARDREPKQPRERAGGERPRGGRGGARGGRAVASRPAKRGPATAEDLDKELHDWSATAETSGDVAM